jgi:hypothetical protein
MGIGGYLMYEAYKNKTPMPVSKATAALTSNKPVQ